MREHAGAPRSASAFITLDITINGGTMHREARRPGEGNGTGNHRENGPATSAATDGRPPLRVMLVDDHVDSRVSVARLLSLLGYEVRAARDGPEALMCAVEFRPDVSLIDLSLPGMDGCSVARRMRTLEATRGTRLIAMTGWATEESEHRTREAGFDLHLLKPLSVDALAHALSGGQG